MLLLYGRGFAAGVNAIIFGLFFYKIKKGAMLDPFVSAIKQVLPRNLYSMIHILATVLPSGLTSYSPTIAAPLRSANFSESVCQ